MVKYCNIKVSIKVHGMTTWLGNGDNRTTRGAQNMPLSSNVERHLVLVFKGWFAVLPHDGRSVIGSFR